MISGYYSRFSQTTRVRCFWTTKVKVLSSLIIKLYNLLVASFVQNEINDFLMALDFARLSCLSFASALINCMLKV